MGVPLLGLPGTPLTISSEKEKEKGKEKKTFEKGKEAEERPLEKRFGFTVTTGFFCFTCKKGCCVFVTYIEILILFLICFCH